MKKNLHASLWGGIHLSLIAVVIIGLMSACSGFGQQTNVQGAIETGVAATRQVEASVATRVAEALMSTATVSASQATATPLPPPTAVPASPTPALPSPTPTASFIIGMGEVRGGPGDLFPVVNIYPQGAQFTVAGVAPGRLWVNVVAGDGKSGWMLATALRFTPPDTLPVVAVPESLQVKGVIMDMAGKPIEGVGVVLWRVSTTGYIHEDGRTGKDGSYTIFLPPSYKGGWSVGLSSYSCTSHIMDANCGFPGGFIQGVQTITLPRTEPVAFYYDSARKENVYWPLANAACQSIKDAVDKNLGGTKTMAEAAFTDTIASETGKGCLITIKGTGVTFPDFNTVAAKIDSILVPQGWTTDKRYDASGPTGMAVAYRKQYFLGLVTIERAPSAAANCAKDKPITECNVKPEQWQYTITLNLAEK